MKKTNTRILLWILTLILAVAGTAPAFASAGDRTIIHLSTNDGYMESSINAVFRDGDGLVVIQQGFDREVTRYADLKAEGEQFDASEWTMTNEKPENLDAEEIDGIYYVSYGNEVGWFSYNGGIYMFGAEGTYENDSSVIKDAAFLRLELKDGKAKCVTTDLPHPDFSEMVEDSGDYQYMNSLNETYVSGDTLYASVYSSNGLGIFAIDLKTGNCRQYEVKEFDEMCGGPDGSLIISRSEWPDNSDYAILRLFRLDTESGDEELLTEFKEVNDSQLNLNYDPETNSLYYVMDGELWRMPDLDPEKAEALNDCPITGQGMLFMPDGFVVVWDSETVVVRNTDPAARGTTVLRVLDNGYSSAISETVYDMNNVRGDISVIIKREYTLKSDILQAMMNRDGTVDIYVLDYDSNEFRALYNRGYLTDLSGNAQIMANMEQIQPYIREALTQDGKVIAVPLAVDGRTVGINMEKWKKAGGTEEELPKTWDQFFDWLETVPEKIANLEEAQVFETWMDRRDFRSNLNDLMTNLYQVRMELKGDDSYAFNNELLNRLVTRAAKIDYDALGLHEPVDDDDEEGGYISYEYKEPLLTVYGSTTVSQDSTQYETLNLAFEEGEDPVLPVTLTVAVVNPFSENAEAAAEYLSLTAKNLRTPNAYTIFTGKTEPVQYAYVDSQLKQMDETIEMYKGFLEKAENGEEKSNIEETLHMFEQDREEMLKYSWVISKEAIENYAKRLPFLTVQRMLSPRMMLSVGDESDLVYKMFYGEESDNVTPDELLNTIDKKIQMMRMEGN